MERLLSLSSLRRSSSVMRENSTGLAATNSRSSTSNTTTQSRSLQLIRTQAMLYAGCFLLTESSNALLSSYYYATKGERPFENWMVQYTVAVLPLQGFWNCLIYFRPRYLKYRKQRKEEKERFQRQQQRENNHHQMLMLQQGNTKQKAGVGAGGAVDVSTPLGGVGGDRQNVCTVTEGTSRYSSGDAVVVAVSGGGIIGTDSDLSNHLPQSPIIPGTSQSFADVAVPPRHTESSTIPEGGGDDDVEDPRISENKEGIERMKEIGDDKKDESRIDGTITVIDC